MNRKFSLGICISLVAIASAITFVLTMTLSLNMYNEKIAGVEEREQIYTKLQEIDSYVRSNSLFSSDKDYLLESIVDGYALGSNDPNARYLTTSEYYEQQQFLKGKIITAGMKVEREEGGYIKVVGVYEGSTAYAQSIRVGDVITSINNEAVLEIGAEAAIKLLSGEEGTRVSINIQRNGEDQKYTLMRQQVEVKSVYGVIYNDFGFIRINGFYENTAEQFKEIYLNMTEKSVKGIIFDVRGSKGVLIQPLKDILNMLVPSTIVATAEYKGGIINNIIRTDEFESVDIPMIVLIDNSTEMISELFTAILKDFKSAQLVGVASSGNAIIPHTQNFRDGTAISISYMMVKSAGGTAFNEGGLKPEYIVENQFGVENDLSNLGATQDAQINKALEVLITKTQ